MPTDTAPFDATADPAIAQVRKGHFLLVDVLATPGSQIWS
jgi:hypothetical protein